jgi:hypothetical protein
VMYRTGQKHPDRVEAVTIVPPWGKRHLEFVIEALGGLINVVYGSVYPGKQE